MTVSRRIIRFSPAIQKYWKAFCQNQTGAIAIYVALFFFTLCLCAVVFLDYSRAQLVRQEMQAAMDRAVLMASRKSIPQSDRVSVAKQTFLDNLLPETRNVLRYIDTDSDGIGDDYGVSFNLGTNTKDVEYIHGEAMAKVPLPFGTITSKLYGTGMWDVVINSRSSISTGAIRNVDFVFVIDASQSMDKTLTKVKENAYTMYINLIAEAAKNGDEPPDGMRVRVIGFRDFLVQYTRANLEARNTADESGLLIPDSVIEKLISGDGEYPGAAAKPADGLFYDLRYPDGALFGSPFFDLENTSGRQSFSEYVSGSSAFRSGWEHGILDHGGGVDGPEFGLQGLNEALMSDFRNPGDMLHSVGKPIEEAYRIIVLWTDETAYPLPYPVFPDGTLNPADPKADKLKKTNIFRWVASCLYLYSHGKAYNPLPDAYSKSGAALSCMGNVNSKVGTDPGAQQISADGLSQWALGEAGNSIKTSDSPAPHNVNRMPETHEEFISKWHDFVRVAQSSYPNGKINQAIITFTNPMNITNPDAQGKHGPGGEPEDIAPPTNFTGSYPSYCAHLPGCLNGYAATINASNFNKTFNGGRASNSYRKDLSGDLEQGNEDMIIMLARALSADFDAPSLIPLTP